MACSRGQGAAELGFEPMSLEENAVILSVYCGLTSVVWVYLFTPTFRRLTAEC